MLRSIFQRAVRDQVILTNPCQHTELAKVVLRRSRTLTSSRSGVISVTQVGDIASVLLGFDNADDLSDGWVDLYPLLRIDRAWKIMNQTATHCSRAALAAPSVSAEHEAHAGAALSSTSAISGSSRCGAVGAMCVADEAACFAGVAWRSFKKLGPGRIGT